jgi:hypothetical protein
MTDHKGPRVQIWKTYDNGMEFNGRDAKLIVLPTLKFM